MPGARSATTSPPLNDFKAWRQRLRRISEKAIEKAESKTASRGAPPSYRKRPINVLKREAYDYYFKLEQAGLLEKLKAYIRDRDGSRWDGHGDDGAQWVCRLFASKDQNERRRKTRSRLSIEMEIARANDVRPELYLGFLCEAGPYEQIEAKWASTNKVYAWADAYRTPRSKLNKRKP